MDSKAISLRHSLKQGLTLYRKSLSKVLYFSGLQSMTILAMSHVAKHLKGVAIVHLGTITSMSILMMLYWLLMIIISLLQNNIFTDTFQRPYQTFRLAANKLLPVFAGMLVASAIFMLGWMLLVIPAILVAPFLLMYYPVAVLANHGVFPSFKVTFKLVWKNWWNTVLMLLFLLLMSFCFVLVISLVIAIAVALIGLVVTIPKQPANMTAVLVSSSLILPLPSAILVSFYHYLSNKAKSNDV